MPQRERERQRIVDVPTDVSVEDQAYGHDVSVSKKSRLRPNHPRYEAAINLPRIDAIRYTYGDTNSPGELF
jgi:hypothetical protein